MTTDLDALIADNRKWVQLHRENKYQREAAKRMTGVLDAIESTLAELRQERERADEAEREAEEITTAWLDKDRQIAKAETALSRAEEIITRALDVRLRMDEMPPREAWPQYKDDIRAVLTEYDKQKGADIG